MSINQIKKHEGYSSKVYLDHLGNPTVGWGHMDKSMKVGDVYPKDKLEKFFQKDYNQAVAAAERFIGQTPIPAAKKDIIVNMAFNLGETGLNKFKKMKAAVRNQDWDTAAAEMKDSKWYGQVGNRSRELVYQMRNLSPIEDKIMSGEVAIVAGVGAYSGIDFGELLKHIKNPNTALSIKGDMLKGNYQKAYTRLVSSLRAQGKIPKGTKDVQSYLRRTYPDADMRQLRGNVDKAVQAAKDRAYSPQRAEEALRRTELLKRTPPANTPANRIPPSVSATQPSATSPNKALVPSPSRPPVATSSPWSPTKTDSVKLLKGPAYTEAQREAASNVWKSKEAKAAEAQAKKFGTAASKSWKFAKSPGLMARALPFLFNPWTGAAITAGMMGKEIYDQSEERLGGFDDPDPSKVGELPDWYYDWKEQDEAPARTLLKELEGEEEIPIRTIEIPYSDEIDDSHWGTLDWGDDTLPQYQYNKKPTNKA